MKPTIPYIEQKFDEFNKQMFDGRLPKLPIELSNAKTFLGMCVYKRRRHYSGREEKYDFRLRINTRFDLAEEEIEDTIIHEMIHYYIGVNQLSDTSAHGKLFRHIMNSINEQFSRHLTISHKVTSLQREQAIDSKPRWHVIATLRLANGKFCIKVIPRIQQRIIYYYNNMRANPDVKSIELYMSNNPYFNRFPNSSALNAQYGNETEILAQLKDASKLECDGRNINTT